ncbi:hypothetical protein B5S27_g4603 [[Candida] boidinii]|nr:hypothetical protein B5S27_g4603 [[Candida] boidinii]
MVSFAELPDDVLETVISFLPQQSKVNLAYTEYKFYALVLPKLYQNILIRYSMPLEPPQKSSEATQAPATGVFLSSTATVIGGSRNDLYSKKQKLEFLKLRQEVLLQSLTINESLLSYIESFTVIDDINDQEDDEEHLFEGEVFDIDLIKLIKKNCQNLQKYNIFCQISELNLADDELETKVNLQSLTLTNLNQLCISAACSPRRRDARDAELHPVLLMLRAGDERHAVERLQVPALHGLPPAVRQVHHGPQVLQQEQR